MWLVWAYLMEKTFFFEEVFIRAKRCIYIWLWETRQIFAPFVDLITFLTNVSSRHVFFYIFDLWLTRALPRPRCTPVYITSINLAAKRVWIHSFSTRDAYCLRSARKNFACRKKLARSTFFIFLILKKNSWNYFLHIKSRENYSLFTNSSMEYFDKYAVYRKKSICRMY